ncbi:MAG TPA: hypothetical protein VGD64_14070 [Acidisarcina sp.]
MAALLPVRRTIFRSRRFSGLASTTLRRAIVAALVTAGVVAAQTRAASGRALQKLTPHVVRLANGKSFSLDLPADFEIDVAAEGLHRVRFLARAPDGRILTTDMHDRSDNSLGVVYILDGFDAATGRFARVIPYLQHLRNPNDVAFYTDHDGQSWLYLPLTDKLERFRYKAGDIAPTGPPEILATYPDYGLNYKYGGWHLTRTVVMGSDHRRDTLFVSVGSSCNNCEEKEPIRATISAMDPDGKNARVIARGMRNAVGLRFVGNTLYATNMGGDHLGDEAPDDPMFALDLAGSEPNNYGWPYCYFQHGKVVPDPMFAGSPKKVDCGVAPSTYAVFAAHSAPLGLEYFDRAADPALGGSFLVALHGASKVSLGTGYRVVRVAAGKHGGLPEDFLTGFLRRGVVYGRPCGILRVGPDAFLLTDDEAGVVYYVHHATPK